MTIVRRSSFATAAAAVLLAFAAPAGATPTPIAPTAGEAMSSQPAFSWLLPAGETAVRLVVSPSPETSGSAGELARSIRSEEVPDGVTAYAFTRKLFAGSYWWQVSSAVSSSERRAAAAQSFTVPAHLDMNMARPTFRKNSNGTTTMGLRFWFRTNLPSFKTKASVYYDGRWRPFGEASQIPWSEDVIGQTIKLPVNILLSAADLKAVPHGERAKLRYTVSGGGRRVTVTRTFRLP